MTVASRFACAIAGIVSLLWVAPAAAAQIPVVSELPAAQQVRAELAPSEREAALWYADRLKFDQIRESGLTGKGVTIAVIDQAINLDAPELQGADIEVMGQFCKFKATGEELPAVTDDLTWAHGTDVVSMLVGNGVAGDGGPGTRGIVPDAKILFYAVGTTPTAEDEQKCEAYNPDTGEFQSDLSPESDDMAEWPIIHPSAFAAARALTDGADVISVSMGESAFALGWGDAQTLAMRAGVPIVAATPNPDGTNSTFYQLPYLMNGVVSVGGVDNDANVIRGLGEYGEEDVEAIGSKNLAFAAPGFQMLVTSGPDGWGPALGSGTSLATPLVAGAIALGLQAHSDATAFQVLQAMIRTTGNAGLSEPSWLGPTLGYGIVNPTAMLAVDPTQFPDENPFFAMQADDPRCGVQPNGEPFASIDDCQWAMMISRPSDVWPSAAGSGAASQGAAGPLVAIAIGAGVFLLVLLIAAAVIVPLLVSRSRQRRKLLIDQAGMNARELP